MHTVCWLTVVHALSWFLTWDQWGILNKNFNLDKQITQGSQKLLPTLINLDPVQDQGKNCNKAFQFWCLKWQVENQSLCACVLRWYFFLHIKYYVIQGAAPTFQSLKPGWNNSVCDNLKQLLSSMCSTRNPGSRKSSWNEMGYCITFFKVCTECDQGYCNIYFLLLNRFEEIC